MRMNSEHLAAAILADQGRKTKALRDRIGAGGINQVIAAGEMLTKHLHAAPAGTTIRDLITRKEC